MNGLRAGIPVAVAGVIIVPVIQVFRDVQAGPGGLWACGFKTPAALIFCEARGKRAVDLTGRELAIADLLRDVPGLDEVLKTVDEAAG